MSCGGGKHRSHGSRHAFIDYLKRTQAENPSFFYAIQGNNNHQYPNGNIFWADATCRINYSCFGDTVRLDTTYKMNCYKVPLVTFSGLNHHCQPVLFGCALLLNDELLDASYVWLLQTWLHAVSGIGQNYPLSITTEPDGILQMAISQVLPQTRHRFCMRSILRETKDKLAHVYQVHPTFEVDFKKCVGDSESINEFESCWALLLERYGLLDNEWLRAMYVARHQCVPIFLRETFFGETDDDDSISSFFTGFINSETTMQMLVKQYENALSNWQDKESEADFETINTNLILKTPSPMEKQAADLYTRRIFMKFQGELVETMANPATKIGESGTVIDYRVAKFGDGHKAHTVRFDSLEMRANCTCQMFESSGITCRHILSVFRAKNVLTLPPVYILKRWTKNAKSGCGALIDNEQQVVHLDEFAIESEETSLAARHSSLKQEAIKFVEEGAKSIHVYNVAMDALGEASKKVVASKKQRSGEMQLIGGDASQISADMEDIDLGQKSTEEKNEKIRILTAKLESTNRRCEVYRANLVGVLRDMEDQKLKLAVKVQNARLSLRE